MGERLNGKVAMVMGAGSIAAGWGNGKAAAVLFAREGAQVLAVDINRKAAEETRDIILNEGGECAVYQGDVSKSHHVQAMVTYCLDRFGAIHVLHNNVGVVEVGGPVETSEESWDRVLSINLKSVFLTCKYVIPVMEKQGGGSIINLSSIAAIRWLGVPYISYNASKAAIRQVTRIVALQYASKQIRCNCILPGLMNTPLVHQSLTGVYGGDLQTLIESRDRQCPMGKMGDAWDIAYAALFLASDESKYITGIDLVVDGGITCSVVEPSLD